MIKNNHLGLVLHAPALNTYIFTYQHPNAAGIFALHYLLLPQLTGAIVPKQDANSAISKPTTAGQASIDPLSILVVEDNAQVNELLCDMLEMLGQRACGALNAESAMELLHNQEFGVLLTDVRLPGMSGIELAKLARQKYPHLQIVLSSGLRTNFGDYLDFDCMTLPKPYDIENLQTLLKEIAGRR